MLKVSKVTRDSRPPSQQMLRRSNIHASSRLHVDTQSHNLNFFRNNLSKISMAPNILLKGGNLSYSAEDAQMIIGAQSRKRKAAVELSRIDRQVKKPKLLSANEEVSLDQEFHRNKAAFLMLQNQGAVEDNMWYLIKDGRLYKTSREKEHLVKEMRQHITESRNWYLQRGGRNEVHVNLSVTALADDSGLPTLGQGQVTLRDPNDTTANAWLFNPRSAIIDSGASITCLSRWNFAGFRNILLLEEVTITFADGRKLVTRKVEVGLQIGPDPDHSIRIHAVPLPTNTNLVGWDILKHYKCTLEFPASKLRRKPGTVPAPAM